MRTLNKFAALAVVCAFQISTASARDDVLHIPLKDILEMPEAKGKIDESIRFYLSGQNTPNVEKKFDTDVSNQKTNGVGKSDEFGCKWAALSALIAFQNKAKQKNANAIVDLHSYYKKSEYKNPTDIECHAGGFVIGVTLKGTYANVAP